MDKNTFAQTARRIALEEKTLYVMGGVGGCLHDKGKSRALKASNKYNNEPARRALIEAADAGTFGFDCVGLIKGILWGWCGDTNPSYSYGGAAFGSAGVPDLGADAMIKRCYDCASDFTTVDIGEMVWMSGHCGIYVGGGLVAESTPIWEDGVQLTACGNLGEIEGCRTRTWTTHGRLPWVDYTPREGEEVRIVGVASGKCEHTSRLVYQGKDTAIAVFEG